MTCRPQASIPIYASETRYCLRLCYLHHSLRRASRLALVVCGVDYFADKLVASFLSDLRLLWPVEFPPRAASQRHLYSLLELPLPQLRGIRPEAAVNTGFRHPYFSLPTRNLCFK